jgi:DNA-binding CsgD family transcriptional regulator
MNIDSLTLQQRTAFMLLIQGMSNADIGQVMHLSEKTVKAHVTEIFKKLGCASRAQLIARHYIEQMA